MRRRDPHDDPPKRRGGYYPPAPPASLASLQRDGGWFWIYCERIGCGHYAPIAIAPFVIRWGLEATAETLCRCARCTRCGHKGQAVLKHPSWTDMANGFQPFPTIDRDELQVPEPLRRHIAKFLLRRAPATVEQIFPIGVSFPVALFDAATYQGHILSGRAPQKVVRSGTGPRPKQIFKIK